MISCPSYHQRVRIRYGKTNPCGNPLWQDRIGIVVIRGTGKPRNHGVLIDGVVVVVPAGNLQPDDPTTNK